MIRLFEIVRKVLHRIGDALGMFMAGCRAVNYPDEI
jgi:hypothetical protein